jgi:uncharacterized membrane protein YdjX (TVP38/TMEM64 family)
VALRGLLYVGLAVGVVLALRAVPVEFLVRTLQSWAETAGPNGMVIFGAAYIALTLLFVPGAPLTMVAGAVFGLGWGILVVAIATTLSDAAGFLLGRYVARGMAMKLMDRYPKFRIVDRTLSLGGWRIVALVRLSPLFPYSVSNYLFGVTSVKFLPYLAASGIFTMPGAFAYLYLGYIGAQAATGGGDSMRRALLALGLAMTLVGIGYVTVLARRAFANLE